MKKRILIKTIRNFIVIFTVLLLGSYFIAALRGGRNTINMTRPTERVRKTSIHLTTPKVSRIKTQGLARYVGVSSSQIEQVFGEPQGKLDSAINVEWWLYNLDSTNYLKIGIDQYTKKVSAIFVTGSNPEQNGNLKVGMTFKKLLQLTSLSANFGLSYHEQKFQLELSEADMNQRPLVGFKNGTYAITYLNPNSQNVDAIEYLDTDMLLKKNIYQVISQTPLPAQYQGDTNWEQMDIMLPFDLMQMINTKRRLLANQTLPIGDPLVQSAHDVISNLTDNPQRYLNNKDARLLKSIMSGDLGQQGLVSLDSGQLPKKLYDDAGLNEKKYKIYCMFPYYENSVLFERLSLRQNIWNDLITGQTEKIGIAYDRGILVVIINK
nr:CAP-associated domain-containing protein [Liquorilactobacillus satsumensis]